MQEILRKDSHLHKTLYEGLLQCSSEDSSAGFGLILENDSPTRIFSDHVLVVVRGEVPKVIFEACPQERDHDFSLLLDKIEQCLLGRLPHHLRCPIPEQCLHNSHLNRFVVGPILAVCPSQIYLVRKIRSEVHLSNENHSFEDHNQ